MPFATDRDLLATEPGLFIDVPFAGQQRIKVTDGVISGTTLNSATADFAAAQVEAGAVVLVAGVPLEVVERLSASLTVSRIRRKTTDAPIPPTPGSALEAIVRTFAPQAQTVHGVLLSRLGIDPDDAGSPLQESMIVSLSVMARLEVLGTLERVYAGAAALAGDNRALWEKASRYHKQFTAAAASARIRLDLDGDGRADFTRELGSVSLVRV